MALEGTLQDFALADILQLIGMQRKTGTLTLTRREEAVTVLVRDGSVVWATPSDEIFEQILGQTLLRRRLLTPERWEKARHLQARKGQPLIPFLLEEEWISPRDLDPVVEWQVLKTLFRAFRWRDGKYSFVSQEQVDLRRGQIRPVETEGILLEAVRQMDEWPLVEQRIPSVDLALRRSSRQVNRERCSPVGQAVLDLVDGRRDIREIAALCEFGDFEVYKGVADLLAEGVLELAQEAEVAGEIRPVGTPRRLPSWAFPVALGSITLASLLLQLYFGRDPLYLLPALQMSTYAEVQSRRLTIAERELSRALDLHLLLHKRYPSDLAELRLEGIVAGEIRDPWGHPWTYHRTGSTYQLTSPGPDGQIGTADDLHISPSRSPD
ncbi:MAG: DUF4388 domain-containing protein [Candidatus Methylomirabilales bacterium]